MIARRKSGLWVPRFSGVTPIVITKTDNQQSGSALTTYTFPARAFGADDASRRIVVGVSSRRASAAATSSVTIGGVTGSLVDEASGTNAGYSVESVWQAAPTGTTGDVVVTFASSMLRCGIIIYSITGSNGAVPTGGATANQYTSASGTTSGSITVPAGGGAIIFSNALSTAFPTFTPTNYSTDLAATLVASVLYHGAGHDNTVGARTYTNTVTVGTHTEGCGVFSAWSP